MKQNLFLPADILLPKEGTDLSRYAAAACDQYTSQPEVWKEAADYVGDAFSALNLIFPEVYLKEGKEAFDARIASINRAMEEAVSAERFAVYENSYFYIERRQRNGAVRRGLIGRIDLEGYNFAHFPEEDVQTPVRATEGTVLSRIPPRVKIRENAPLELPHVMLLVDDPEKSCIEKIGAEKEQMQKLYDFDLMQDSGHLTGWLVKPEQTALIDALVCRLSDGEKFREQYGLGEDSGKQPLVFAVGDGNHSLATARQCWDNIKESLTPSERENHPARYALVELCNLHDEALVFEPIHRMVTNVNIHSLTARFRAECDLTFDGKAEGQKFYAVVNGQKYPVVMQKSDSALTVGSIQNFLDRYSREHPEMQVDYIHGEEVVLSLSKEENSIGFILEGMEKEELFPTVIADRALPRKTFSMGEAWDKRFYCEARKIR